MAFAAFEIAPAAEPGAAFLCLDGIVLRSTRRSGRCGEKDSLDDKGRFEDPEKREKTEDIDMQKKGYPAYITDSPSTILLGVLWRI